MKLTTIASIGIAGLIWLTGLTIFNLMLDAPMFLGWWVPVGVTFGLSLLVILWPNVIKEVKGGE